MSNPKLKPNENYFKFWRDRNPFKWHLTQLKWYYKNRKRILAGWRKPEPGKEDEYDKWSERFEDTNLAKEDVLPKKTK